MSLKHKIISDIEQKHLIALLKNEKLKLNFVLIGKEAGFEIVVESKKETYRLFTQRKKPRLFKSPTTALEFLNEIGVCSVRIENFCCWVDNKKPMTADITEI